jgi:hypothetical protein
VLPSGLRSFSEVVSDEGEVRVEAEQAVQVRNSRRWEWREVVAR